MQMIKPIIWVFLAITVIIIAFKAQLIALGWDANLLLGGNILLFLLGLVSLLFLGRSAAVEKPQAFIRNFYLSFMVKFLLVAVTVLIYATTAEKINRLSVIVCMGLYLVYTFIEVRIITKASKRQDAK